MIMRLQHDISYTQKERAQKTITYVYECNCVCSAHQQSTAKLKEQQKKRTCTILPFVCMFLCVCAVYVWILLLFFRAPSFPFVCFALHFIKFSSLLFNLFCIEILYACYIYNSPFIYKFE